MYSKHMYQTCRTSRLTRPKANSSASRGAAPSCRSFGQGRVLIGDTSATAYQQVSTAYVAARQTLASDDDKLAQAQAALREARQSLANTPFQRQVIEEDHGIVVQSEGSVAKHRTAVEQTTITAPFDGVVTSRSLDPGSFAGPSQAIFVISQIDPVYVGFNVKDADLVSVRSRTPVTFSTSANPNRQYAGRVTPSMRSRLRAHCFIAHGSSSAIQTTRCAAVCKSVSESSPAFDATRSRRPARRWRKTASGERSSRSITVRRRTPTEAQAAATRILPVK
jgi:hypothetical protein